MTFWSSSAFRAIELDLGLRHGDLGVDERRLRRLELRLDCASAALKRGRIDLRDELPFLTWVLKSALSFAIVPETCDPTCTVTTALSAPVAVTVSPEAARGPSAIAAGATAPNASMAKPAAISCAFILNTLRLHGCCIATRRTGGKRYGDINRSAAMHNPRVAKKNSKISRVVPIMRRADAATERARRSHSGDLYCAMPAPPREVMGERGIEIVLRGETDFIPHRLRRKWRAHR